MPTTPEEVREMTAIVNQHLHPDESADLFAKLYDRVGEKSDNLSVKLSLLMFKVLYARDGRTVEEKMASLPAIFESYSKTQPTKVKMFGDLHVHQKTILGGVVLFHLAVIVAVIVSTFSLPFTAPWSVAILLTIYTANLIFAPNGCVLTKLEDSVRRRFGLPEIKKFIQHYVWKKYDNHAH